MSGSTAADRAADAKKANGICGSLDPPSGTRPGYAWNDAFVWNEGYVWNDAFVWNESYVWNDALTTSVGINHWVEQE